MGIGRWIYIYIIYILYYIFIYYIILYYIIYIYYIYIYILLYVQNLDFLFCLESRNWIFVLWILALPFCFMYRVILMIGRGVVESTPVGYFFCLWWIFRNELFLHFKDRVFCIDIVRGILWCMTLL